MLSDMILAPARFASLRWRHYAWPGLTLDESRARREHGAHARRAKFRLCRKSATKADKIPS
jgi:hypothetical protein